MRSIPILLQVSVFFDLVVKSCLWLSEIFLENFQRKIFGLGHYQIHKRHQNGQSETKDEKGSLDLDTGLNKQGKCL